MSLDSNIEGELLSIVSNKNECIGNQIVDVSTLNIAMNQLISLASTDEGELLPSTYEKSDNINRLGNISSEYYNTTMSLGLIPLNEPLRVTQEVRKDSQINQDQMPKGDKSVQSILQPGTTSNNVVINSSQFTAILPHNVELSGQNIGVYPEEGESILDLGVIKKANEDNLVKILQKQGKIPKFYSEGDLGGKECDYQIVYYDKSNNKKKSLIFHSSASTCTRSKASS